MGKGGHFHKDMQGESTTRALNDATMDIITLLEKQSDILFICKRPVKGEISQFLMAEGKFREFKFIKMKWFRHTKSLEKIREHIIYIPTIFYRSSGVIEPVNQSTIIRAARRFKSNFPHKSNLSDAIFVMKWE